MNVLTKIRLINELNDKELRLGVVNTSSSWHNQYKDSAWVYVGNLPYELSEGDVICVFSQYGEIVNVNLIREKKTGKSKGFAFVCYEDQRSTILAVDNLNGSKIKSRELRVDHVLAYKVPKEDDNLDELTQKIHEKGVAPSTMKEYEETSNKGEPPSRIEISDETDDERAKKKKKEKKKLSFLKEKATKKKSKVASHYQSGTDSETEKMLKKKKRFSDKEKNFGRIGKANDSDFEHENSNPHKRKHFIDDQSNDRREKRRHRNEIDSEKDRKKIRREKEIFENKKSSLIREEKKYDERKIDSSMYERSHKSRKERIRSPDRHKRRKRHRSP